MRSPLIRRKRQRSIRVLLSVIFVVPLASLIGLWAFAASVTVTNAIREHNFKTENTLYGGSAQGLGTQLDKERLVAYEYLSSGRRMPAQPLLQQIALTRAAENSFFKGVQAGPGMLQPSSFPSLTAWENDLRGPLNTLRTEIESGRIAPLAAFNAYNQIIDAQFGVYSQLIKVDNISLYQQAQGSIEAGRALELAERETTLITGALEARGQMSKATKLEFASEVYDKQLLMTDALTELTPATGSGYQAILTSQPYQEFGAIENAIIASIGANGPIPVSPTQFGAVTTPLFASYQNAETQDRNALTREGTQVGDQLLLEVGLAGGAGLLAIILSILLMIRFGRRISRELRGLQTAALELAEDRLPRVVHRLGQGEDVDVAAEVTPIPTGRIVETARVAEAFSSVQRTAVEAAVGQARLRRGVSQVFRNLAWRSQSLLHRQLALLDTMERRQTEPETLDELFQLDHLTTRMRRHAEGLIILSGATPGRGWRDPVPIMDVIRAAIAEVEDYKRVSVLCDSQDAVVGTAVADIIHLLAELIENAATYSPANTEVTVRAEQVANGFVIEIEDRGIGINIDDLILFNQRLENPPEFDLADSNQLGLFVVARLAGKHSISVTLRRSPYGGTSAIVLLPNAAVATADRGLAESFDAFRELPAATKNGLPMRNGNARSRDSAIAIGETVSSMPAPVQESGATSPSRLAPYVRAEAEPWPEADQLLSAPRQRASDEQFSSPSRSVSGEGFGSPRQPASDELFGSPSRPASDELFGSPSRSVSGEGFGLPRQPASDELFGSPSRSVSGEGFGLPSRSASDELFGSPSRSVSGEAFGPPRLPASDESFGSPPQPASDQWSSPEGRPAFGTPGPPWEAAAAPPSAGDPAGQASTSALPRRQRQASLAPQLRNERPAADEGMPDGSDGLNPAASRALVESLQHGLDLARATPPAAEDPWPPSGSWPQDPWPTPEDQ
jgi:signal transduction histidine kinase